MNTYLIRSVVRPSEGIMGQCMERCIDRPIKAETELAARRQLLENVWESGGVVSCIVSAELSIR